MRRALPALTLALATLGACNRPPADPAEPEGSAASGASTTAATATVAASDSPCEEVEKKLCAESGEKSSNCEAFGLLKGVLAPEACAAELSHFEHTKTQLANATKDCDTLVARLCAEVQTETCQMVTQATKRFPPQQCTSMLEQIDKVVAELKAEEAKNQPITGELLAALHAPNAPSFGPADAKVTVVEFSDFQCPYCARAAQVARDLKKKYPTQVRFVFRQYPLSFHQNAQKASEAALAANAQGKFWAYHDKLFENQQALGLTDLKRYAADVGLNAAAVDSALESSQYAEAVKADVALGDKVYVQGTPTLFVNGKRVHEPSLAGVSQLIDAELAN